MIDDPRNVRFFEFLSDEERAEFAEAAEFAAFESGEGLIEESAKPSSLFVLTSGQGEVRKRVPGDGDRLLAILDATNERTVVGEMDLVTEPRAAATVTAKGPVEARRLPRKVFLERLIREWGF